MTRDEFLYNSDDGNTHRVLLWLALNLTSTSALPVGEFGAGYDSTPYLRMYCSFTGRKFYSYDNNPEWANQWDAEVVTDWLSPELYKESSVVLIDQNPGDDRRHSAYMLRDKAMILVIHDAEPANNHSYHLDEVDHVFKYKVCTKGPKIWTIALSNKINLNKHAGEQIGNIKIEL